MSKILEKVLNRLQDSIIGRFDSGTQPGEENIIDPKIVPDPEEGEDYVTHRYVNEQEDEEEEKAPEETGEEMGGGEDLGGEAGMGGDMGAGGMDTGMGGGFGTPGEEEKPKDIDELGRRYELKKIYARLVSIESNLSDSPEVELLKLRNYVSQAIDLFKTMINNIDLFKETIDEIIVVYYEFLKYTYAVLKKFYEEKEAKK